MINVTRKKFGLEYYQHSFARKWSWLSGLSFTTYSQYIGEKQPGFLFLKQTHHTFLLDITLNDEALLAGMDKNMRSQLRKAKDDGFVWEQEKDFEVFKSFFNHFAEEKGLTQIDEVVFKSQSPFLYIGKITWNGQILVAHSYLVDHEESRARFLNGASSRLDEGVDTALIGRANRLCHFIEMGKFRELGIKTFDFGGFALNTTDPQKQGINQFKKAFGGRVEEESTFDSVIYALAGLLKSKK
jgi:hypothetical protein